uniref:Uncharacterized protein n=1 Tax=Steinernema glaseri TaxID=37863 RepID=A0A1I7ZGZ7_9BILA
MTGKADPPKKERNIKRPIKGFCGSSTTSRMQVPMGTSRPRRTSQELTLVPPPPRSRTQKAKHSREVDGHAVLGDEGVHGFQVGAQAGSHDDKDEHQDEDGRWHGGASRDPLDEHVRVSRRASISAIPNDDLGRVVGIRERGAGAANMTPQDATPPGQGGGEEAPPSGRRRSIDLLVMDAMDISYGSVVSQTIDVTYLLYPISLLICPDTILIQYLVCFTFCCCL